jgi:hypothetical protein
MRWLLYVKRPVASSAKGVAGPELNQPTIFVRATHNFARIHTDNSGRHRLSAERQSWYPGVPYCTTTMLLWGNGTIIVKYKIGVNPKKDPNSSGIPKETRTNLINRGAI